MKKSGNRGVSLIEILIAVAIFVICITPIINQLITSIRIGQRADDQQAATDYGKSMTEAINQANLDNLINIETDSVDKDALAELLLLESSSIQVTYTVHSVKKDGSAGKAITEPSSSETFLGKYIISSPDDPNPDYAGTNSINKLYYELKKYNGLDEVDADEQEALVREYKITGRTRDRGVNYRSYDVEISFNNLSYAIASLNNQGFTVYDSQLGDYVYTDPNAVNLGNLSNLDAETTAVITASSNYDFIASNAFYSNIVAALDATGNLNATYLKNGDSEYITALSKGAPTKETTINVEKKTTGSGSSEKTVYHITCDLTYVIDVSSMTDTKTATCYEALSIPDRTLSYSIYDQYFDTIPDIYLMYNQYLYMKSYGDDKIRVDSNVTGDDPVKVFVVRTAAYDDDSNRLIPSTADTSYEPDRKNGDSYLYMTNFELVNTSTANDYGALKLEYPVMIYTNIPLKQTSGLSTVNNWKYYVSGDRTCKMTINIDPAPYDSGNPTGSGTGIQVIHALTEDERYSSNGRMYDVTVTLTNDRSGVTKFDSSKGDY